VLHKEHQGAGYLVTGEGERGWRFDKKDELE
jgi:hypothetical protein